MNQRPIDGVSTGGDAGKSADQSACASAPPLQIPFPWLSLPLSATVEAGKRNPSLIAVGLSRKLNSSGCDGGKMTSLPELLEQPLDAILIIDSTLWEAFHPSVSALLEMMRPAEASAIILVSRRPPPVVQFRSDGPVFSFLCPPSILKQVLANAPEAEPREFCFELLHQILNSAIRPVDRLIVRQIPADAASVTQQPSSLPASVIVAHRGPHRYLSAALHYLSCAEYSDPLQVRVGLDVDAPEDYRSLSECYPDVAFCSASPAPVGPYVIRQELACRSSEPLLVLQDSDDLSCYDRFATLAGKIANDECDMIGSHELRVDEIERHVVAVRFPLDASAALKDRNVFALLHATQMIRRNAFFTAGGLSTDQRVANDTQFLMRAYFYLRICNADEFLYIRRRHARSLTIAPETAAGNELRTRLDSQWTEDFEAVKRGEITLEESSLRPMRTTSIYRIEAAFRNSSANSQAGPNNLASTRSASSFSGR